MKTLKDSSEIQEAARILDELAGPAAWSPPRTPGFMRRSAPQPAPAPRQAPPRPSAPAAPTQLPPPPPEGETRGARLENVLYAMCKRGGFKGAVIADDDGLPLAVFNSPVQEEAISAFTIVLGDALSKAAKLLDQHDANNISMDINYTDKVVLRRFFINEIPSYLMVICSQEVDERGEIELSIDQVAGILHAR
ncbi:hypothetical protein SAMN02745216_00597 [Desulfatibacillum alkenivorans DSM 16219]|uniref:Roadblock/LAMTOR2 domain-containing protein n=1 Tax=Desulfatibacillum alkenivorans DSM 16219 TaxID=1121393 RepID=A0A1M6E9M6_9BACT|nr:hypothetical protein [Desulfatibacillum alkenivorans]SHI82123.1 hypothetical protein SAMN02745216_00597 [Desulfatibacillum alkenivorans DSM 16219]